MLGVFLCGYISGYLFHEDEQPLERTVVSRWVVGGAREKTDCEFDPPLKYLNLIMHWYDTNEEMFADYITLAEPNDREEIWGWSNCLWQPEDSWAVCDVYIVEPVFVYADMNIDTIGHEVFHGACGDFHE